MPPGREVASLVAHVVARPHRLQHLERLVEQLVALGVVTPRAANSALR